MRYRVAHDVRGVDVSKLVDDLSPSPPRPHKACSAQHAEMLTDQRLRSADRIDQFVHAVLRPIMSRSAGVRQLRYVACDLARWTHSVGIDLVPTETGRVAGSGRGSRHAPRRARGAGCREPAGARLASAVLRMMRRVRPADAYLEVPSIDDPGSHPK